VVPDERGAAIFAAAASEVWFVLAVWHPSGAMIPAIATSADPSHFLPNWWLITTSVVRPGAPTRAHNHYRAHNRTIMIIGIPTGASSVKTPRQQS
jgi:hypothetical protein